MKFSSTHCSNQEDEEPSSNKPVRKSKKSPRGASKSPEKRASRSPTKGRKKKPSRLDPQGKFFKNSMNSLDTIQDFLCNLGMKPHTPSGNKHFSLNHVIVRHTAIIKDHWKASGLFYVLALQRMYLNNFGRSDDDII